MNRRFSPRLARFFWAVCVTGTLAEVVLTIGSSTSLGTDEVFNIIIPSGLLAFPTVGAIVASRDKGNVIGWLFLVFGLVSTIGTAADTYAAFHPALPGGVYGSVVGAATIDSPAVMTSFVFFLLLFPDGRLPSRLWRHFARFCGVVTGFVVLYAVFVQPAFEVSAGKRVANPVAIRALTLAANAIQGPLYLALIVCVPAAAVSFVMRFRRSRNVEREQMKWFASAAVLMGVMVGLSPVAFSPRAPKWLWPVMFLAGASSIPIAAGIAVLRYRLYDIDRIVSRTVSYAIVTAILVGAYIGLVVSFQSVTRPLTGRSDLAVAASTLVAAAAFVPLRLRVQNAVDHKFNRRRYDAEHTIDAFSVRLRDEVDIATLRSDLEDLVRQTMQPSHVSLWIASPSSGGRVTA